MLKKIKFNIWWKFGLSVFFVMVSIMIAYLNCYTWYTLGITFVNGMTVGMWVIMLTNHVHKLKMDKYMDNKNQEMRDFLREMNNLHNNNMNKEDEDE